MRENVSQVMAELAPRYQSYDRQKCFVAYSKQAAWSADLLSACEEVLRLPEFNLEPDYAEKHFDPDIPLRVKALELITNSRYGIYDLSSWHDKNGRWQMPRNVFIELGMAIASNRPTLLVRHSSNRLIELPKCLQSIEGHILEFGGETTLKHALKKRLPQWVNAPPDRDWWNRYCIFGNKKCEYREANPRSRQWGKKMLRCHIADGPDLDRDDFRSVVENVLGRFSEISTIYVDAWPLSKGYEFLLCTNCQAVRSTPFGIYRITAASPAETFITIGMSIALEAQFNYKIPKILLTERVQNIPSLLTGYEVVEASNDKELKSQLRAFIPTVAQKVRETSWRPRPLPFIEDITHFTEEKETAGHPNQGKLIEALKQILQNAREVLGADYSLIWPYDSVRDMFLPEELVTENIPEDLLKSLREDESQPGRTARVVLEDGYISVEDVTKSVPDFLGTRTRVVLAALGVKSFQGIRLEVGGEALGVFYADYKIGRGFGTEERRILEAFANNAALSLKHARLADQVNRSHRAAQAIAGVSTLGKIEDTLQAIVEGARDALHCDIVTLYTFSEETRRFDLAQGVSFRDPNNMRSPAEISSRSALWKIINLQEIFYHVAEDALNDDLLMGQFVGREGVKAAIAIQLRLRERRVGVMFLNYLTPHRFTEDEIEDALLFSNEAAVAIRNAQLLEESENAHLETENVRRPSATIEIPNSIAGTTIEELGLSKRTSNKLKTAGISNVGELLERLKLGEQELLTIRDFGKKSLDELTKALAAKGYSRALPASEVKVADQLPGQKPRTRMSPEQRLLLDIFEGMEGRPSALDPAEQERLASDLSDILEGLSDRERKVLELRFGLPDGKPRTQKQVASEFGVSENRIRDLEKKALRKLRHPIRSRKLRDYLG